MSRPSGKVSLDRNQAKALDEFFKKYKATDAQRKHILKAIDRTGELPDLKTLKKMLAQTAHR